MGYRLCWLADQYDRTLPRKCSTRGAFHLHIINIRTDRRFQALVISIPPRAAVSGNKIIFFKYLFSPASEDHQVFDNGNAPDSKHIVDAVVVGREGIWNGHLVFFAVYFYIYHIRSLTTILIGDGQRVFDRCQWEAPLVWLLKFTTRGAQPPALSGEKLAVSCDIAGRADMSIGSNSWQNLRSLFWYMGVERAEPDRQLPAEGLIQ